MRELRKHLRIEALSRMSVERRNAILPELEQMAESRDIEAPAGAWVGPFKETLVATVNGIVVGSVTVQTIPVLEPVLLDAGSDPANAALLEPLLRRAEGFAQALGHDEVFAILSEGSPDAYMNAITRDGEEKTSSVLLVCREL